MKPLSSRCVHFFLLACSLLPVAVLSTHAKDTRPNFIFIITDDQRWDALSVVQKEQGEAGRFPWLKTPNMDRIADEGVRLRNSFVTLSLCSPSRAAFLTGQYNHVNGVTTNHKPFPAENVTYAQLMRDAGYQTAFFGKFHHGKQPGPRPGFEYNVTFIDQGRYVDCPFEINGVMTPTQGWVDDVNIDYAIDFLKQTRTKPFSMFVGFKTPHEPTFPPERTKDLYKGELARVVPNMVTPSVFRLSKKDAERKKIAEAAIKEKQGVKVGLDYFRCISACDDSLGRLLKTLDDLDLTNNTVLVFTSDNGYYLGEHCLGDKRSAYDESLRVPLLIRYPQLFPKGKVIDDMVLNIDIAPTFLELAGIPVPSFMQGKSIVPVLNGDNKNWRKSFLAEYFIEKDYPNTPTLVSLRTNTLKLTKYPGHDEMAELFNLEKDPFELNNLANDPEQAGVLASMNAEFDRQSTAMGYCIPEGADKAEFDPTDPEDKKAHK